ncbi:TonB-dependent receptor [Flexithrix dorotheae]|uniref:TonB-dependent receptor n=1 Tax=Flexithrix dorotheae TaxID=70993 RepID=UPI0003A11D32|nr:TonB-dependent receptor [Flexithrix dorotheae]
MKLKILRQILMMSKYTLFGFFVHCFLCGMLVANDANSQKNSVEEIFLTLNLEAQPLELAFKEIQSKTSFDFAYNKSVIDKKQLVTIKAQNESLGNILRYLSKNTGLRFKRVDESIHVGKKEIFAPSLEEVISNTFQVKITGLVTAEDGEALPGVSILIKGTTNGTTTGLDGTYSLNVPENSIIQYSYIGYQTKEIEVVNQSVINVALAPDLEQLEEVVVIGYGTQKKTTVTGAVSSISGDEISEIPVPNITHSMAGRMPGVIMRPTGGQPGFDDPSISIRGVVTTGNSAPLVVVDGIIRDNIRQIDPSTIENVTVLKDAAAVAPYGMGGANGVILITTKKGKSGKPVVRFNTSLGFQNPTYVPDMLSARDYMILQNEGYYNQTPDGTTPPNDPQLIADYNRLHQEDPWRYPDSEFIDVWNKNALIQNHNVELSGGTDNVNYHAGVGFYDQQGLFDPVNYKRYNFNLSLEMKATKTTKVGISLYGTVEKTNSLDPDEQIAEPNNNGEISGHLFRSFYKFIPTQSLIYPGGEQWGESSASTPVGALKSPGYKKTDRNTLLSSVYIEQQLSFIEGLSIKGVFGYDPTTQNRKSWHVPFIYHVIDLDADPYTFQEAVSLQEGNGKPYKWLSLDNWRSNKYTLQGFINYNRTFGDHSITALAVAESQQTQSDNFWARRNNFAVDLDELSMGSSNKLDYDNGGGSSTGSQLGYVYRVAYSYKDKYMLESSGRYDGHYYFAPGNRWAFFPSFSAAWRISEEGFMSKLSAIENLKIRGSWGQSGNLAGGPFQYLEGYQLRGNAYAFGPGNLVQASKVPREANPEITWEISTKYNFGFDLYMWNGLLRMEFDYFHELRDNMLLQPQVTLPVEYGLPLSEENKGEMKNNGIELSIGTNKEFGNGLNVGLMGNFTYAKNQMIEVFQSQAEAANPNRTRVGQPFGTPFGFKSLGMFTTSDDINGDGVIDGDDGYNVTQFGVLHPGDVKYADLSGPEGVPDGLIDANDETSIGYPTYPLMTWGLTALASWKGFDFNMFFQGSGKSSINVRQFMTVPFENNGSNTSYEYFNNRWTPDSQDAKYPRSTPSPYANNTKNSDFWMVNTSFFRLKNLTLGYTLPKTILGNSGIGPVRIYYIGQNLFTVSNLKHIDPELGPGIRENSYPIMQTHMFGLNVSF